MQNGVHGRSVHLGTVGQFLVPLVVGRVEMVEGMFGEVDDLVRLEDLLRRVQRLLVVDRHVDGAEVAAESERDDHPHDGPGEEEQVAGAAFTRWCRELGAAIIEEI